jgi:hypothetical protein
MTLNLREQTAYVIFRDADVHGTTLPRARCLDLAEQILIQLFGDLDNVPPDHRRARRCVRRRHPRKR